MTPEHRHPRRRDRSKDEGWIKDLLHRGEAAVMAAILDGAPFCLPRIYAFDEERGCIYVHGAFGGATGKVFEQGGEESGAAMALTVFEMGRLLPADEALEFGVEYASVVVTGRAREIGDSDYLLNQAENSLDNQRSSCEFWNDVNAGLTQSLSGYPRDCGGFTLDPETEAQILANNDVFPFNFRREPWSLDVQVSLPVFQGFGRQRQVAEARAAADDARLDRVAEELRLETAVTQAYDELMTATQVVGIEERNREVAGEQLELAQERYRLGGGTFLELLEAQSSMATAERDYLNARYRFHGAIWALEASVGQRLRPETSG